MLDMGRDSEVATGGLLDGLSLDEEDLKFIQVLFGGSIPATFFRRYCVLRVNWLLGRGRTEDLEAAITVILESYPSYFLDKEPGTLERAASILARMESPQPSNG